VGGACVTHERGKKHVQGLVRKPEGKRPLGRTRSGWENGIKMYLRDTGWCVCVCVCACACVRACVRARARVCVWIYLSQDTDR
jgi:hypothetical protein